MQASVQLALIINLFKHARIFEIVYFSLHYHTYTTHPYVIMPYFTKDHIMKLNIKMKCSHDGLTYSYVLMLLHLSYWYYLTVRLPKRNFLFFEFKDI